MADQSPRVLLFGAAGMLGSMFRRRAPADWRLLPWDIADCDMTAVQTLRARVAEVRPELIINCAAWTAVDACEENPDLANRINGEAVATLAVAARDCQATLVHLSTDYVFPGTADRPYREDDQTGPATSYGRSKLAGENAILASGLQDWLIVRTSWLYGPYGGNFVETILRLAGEREKLQVVADQVGSPCCSRDLVDAILTLLVQKKRGCYHFANSGSCSWYEFATAILDGWSKLGAELPCEHIDPVSSAEYPRPARRPGFSVLDTGKFRHETGAAIAGWRESLQHYLRWRWIHRG